MSCAFEIHHDLGRFFDEKIYKKELALRYPGVQLEVPIELIHGSFSKFQYIDVLVSGGGVFEFKTVDVLTSLHSAQLLQYLLVAELGHGKLVNLRKETVQHEFVNTTLRHKDRVCFSIAEAGWDQNIPGAQRFSEILTTLLRDWGTGLDVQLYEEAVTHLLGGEQQVLADVPVRTQRHLLGHQRMHLAAPSAAFALTALPEPDPNYDAHLRRLLRNTELDTILWANIALKQLTFSSVSRSPSVL
jgi:GxxExxY protein